jgi:diacylglycerol kinase
MVHIKKLSASFKYALTGIMYVLKHDQNLRIHVVIAALVLLIGMILHITTFELSILLVMIILVICAEMINSTIEQMVDLITTEHRKQAEIAKDVAAGMVLITAIGAVVVGILVLLPYILHSIF